MPDWLEQLIAKMAEGRSLTLPAAGSLPGTGRALALAPHPDDPDAVGITLRALHQGGWAVRWTILASGWSGVQDSEAGPDSAAKARLRETEQRDAAAYFGLSEDRLLFLRLTESEAGKMLDTEENRRALFAHLDACAPDLVLLPHGDDTHPDHRLTYRWLNAWAAAQSRRIILLGNEDPKTEQFRPDLLITYGAEAAAWKAGLLECHRSQSLRNQRTRGLTFAERILAVNRDGDGYAERFQVAVWQG